MVAHIFYLGANLESPMKTEGRICKNLAGLTESIHRASVVPHFVLLQPDFFLRLCSIYFDHVNNIQTFI